VCTIVFVLVEFKLPECYAIAFPSSCTKVNDIVGALDGSNADTMDVGTTLGVIVPR